MIADTKMVVNIVSDCFVRMAGKSPLNGELTSMKWLGRPVPIFVETELDNEVKIIEK